jgi:hypothetical protein
LVDWLLARVGCLGVGWLLERLVAMMTLLAATADAAGGGCCVSVSLRTETLKNRKEERL